MSETRISRITKPIFLILFVALVPSVSTSLIPGAHADLPFVLTPSPAIASEGSSINLVLSATGASPNTLYQFRFSVTDPTGRTTQSGALNFTTGNQDTFTMTVVYPSSSLQGPNNLVGQYVAKVDELFPTPALGIAGTSFILTVTNSLSYQRTQTIFIQASGYNASESVTLTIRTQTSSTLVYIQSLPASSSGLVSTSWKIPKNATIDNYVVSLSGTSTFKSKPDSQTVSIGPAILTINTLTTDKSTYQRTDTIRLSLQPTYPDGTIATTGSAIVTLTPPVGTATTLTATYNGTTQTFTASHKTLLTDLGGTWTASLATHSYSDPDANSGPAAPISTTLQVTPVSITINLTVNTNTLDVGQQLKVNASLSYPDGTTVQSGTVKAYLVYGGTPALNETIPIAYDSGLKIWFGTYTIRPADTGGLWSILVTAADSPNPPNSGSATKPITIQNAAGSNTSLPLFYFALVGALIAALLAAVLLLFKRRKVTQTRLKIDLDAVKSEAGKIESSDFFKSVKGQVTKEKDDQ